MRKKDQIDYMNRQKAPFAYWRDLAVQETIHFGSAIGPDDERMTLAKYLNDLRERIGWWVTEIDARDSSRRRQRGQFYGFVLKDPKVLEKKPE